MKWSITIDRNGMSELEQDNYTKCYEDCLKGESDALAGWLRFDEQEYLSDAAVARWACIYLTAYRDALKELARRAG